MHDDRRGRQSRERNPHQPIEVLLRTTERVEPGRRNEAASARLGPGTDRCAVDHTVEDADERLRRASLEPGQVADEAVPRRDRDVLDVNDVAGVDLFRDAMNGEADVFGVVECERPHRAVRALVVGQHTEMTVEGALPGQRE